MEDIRNFFKEINDEFTIYVVERRFVAERGAEYFRFYKGKENYIDTNTVMKRRLIKILQGINKRIPNSAELIKNCFNIVTPMGLIDIISSLCKVFTVQEHQAAGPDVIDPIIIQEGEILPKYVNQIVALHKTSILRPVIIILLKDNNFERAKELLSGCPHNTNIKMIRNNGDTEIYKVINCGVDNPDDFLDAFSHQCFNTCSNTKRSILYNEDWAENSLIKLFAPSILQLRTQFLYQDKTLVRKDLLDVINTLENKKVFTDEDVKLKYTFQCILKLYNVFCHDGGKKDISEAYDIAKAFDNKILLAQVYRYSYFLDGFTYEQKLELLDEAYNIFSEFGMQDNAIYCKNNSLVRSFDRDNININDFLSLQEKAVYNVPGLVGMSHILNNVGVAHLMTGFPGESITFFEKGLDYAYRPERCLQKIALLCNTLIAKSYCFNKIDDSEFFKIMNMIFDNSELLNIPFITARYASNIIAIAFEQSKTLGNELLIKYPIKNLIQKGFNDNIIGSGQLLSQLNMLESKHNINILNGILLPDNYINITGIRKKFLEKTGYNPFIFSTWL